MLLGGEAVRSRFHRAGIKRGDLAAAVLEDSELLQLFEFDQVGFRLYSSIA